MTDFFGSIPFSSGPCFGSMRTTSTTSKSKLLRVTLDAPWRQMGYLTHRAWYCDNCSQDIYSLDTQPSKCPSCGSDFSGGYREISEIGLLGEREKKYSIKQEEEYERYLKMRS